MGDESAKGVGRGEDGGWGGGGWWGGRREKMDSNFAIFLGGLQRKAESCTR